MIALSVAGVLAVFLLYTSLAGGGTPTLQPSELSGRTGKVALAGKVIGPVTGDAHAGGLRFTIRDVGGTASVPVVYTAASPARSPTACVKPTPCSTAKTRSA